MKYKRGECTKQNLPVFNFQGYQLYLTFPGNNLVSEKVRYIFIENIYFATSIVFYLILYLMNKKLLVYLCGVVICFYGCLSR